MSGERAWVALWCALGVSACGGIAAPDLSVPTGPVVSLLDAAKAGDPAYLGGLCDPKGETDSDARRVCRASARVDDWELVKRWFADARIRLPARVDGDKGEVEIDFGPGAQRHTTVEVVRRDGRWYLRAF